MLQKWWSERWVKLLLPWFTDKTHGLCAVDNQVCKTQRNEDSFQFSTSHCMSFFMSWDDWDWGRWHVASGRKKTRIVFICIGFPLQRPWKNIPRSYSFLHTNVETAKQMSKQKKRCEHKIWDSQGHCHPQTHKIHRLSLVRWPIACRLHSLPGRQLNQSWFLIKPFSANHHELVQSLHLRFLLQQLAGGSLAIFSETDKFHQSQKGITDRALTSKFPKT